MSADLNARVRLEAAGAGVRTARSGNLIAALDGGSEQVLVLDLDAGGPELLAEVAAAGAKGLLPDRVVGFYSHIDENLGAAARAAGVKPVPRGTFWSTLADWVA